ncbi:RES domain-containing protein [Idiomarina sp. Sol25]|uniref:RES domain-containing protein n=1 Tax=Idiomarina sp. Sol25 TaxID=3064000 RepID=UPI00294B1338|nr:RES domain-containing protein [Idiomarina sp. Sol25]MDV6328543.1 RES domain-containing protein [Idiomarina sp. Sol25]
MSREKKVLDIDAMHKLALYIKRSSCASEVTQGLEYALQFYDIINFNFIYDRAFLRARLTESGEPWKSTSEIYYPPGRSVKAGRVNDVGEPFLYMSLTLDTALSEINAKEGDIVQIGAYRTKESKKLRVGMIGEKFRVARGSGHFLQGKNAEPITKLINKLDSQSKLLSRAYLYPDLFFDEILTDEDAAKSQYLHSRILANLILSKHKDIDGLFYHSVLNEGSKNIALPGHKADELLGLEHTVLVKVKKAYPYGLFLTELIKTPENILPNGDVIWD